jgi:hypothetical protein
MRCYICNYCSDTFDLDDEERLDKPRKVVYDKETGQEICTSCLESARRTIESYTYEEFRELVEDE